MRQDAEPGHLSPRSLAASLAPALARACEDRLSQITWFKADWQRGGAATGTSTYRIDGGGSASVVVKLPVVQRELLWMQRLQGSDVVPRLYASGSSLEDYDLAWIVIEQFPYGPLGAHWHDDHTQRVAEAAASFYAASDRYPVDQEPVHEQWDQLLRDASESLKINKVPKRQQWRNALKTLRHRAPRLAECWESRNATQWLHGDLHMANAMSRTGLESGPVCLIDLADVHAGHWVEDAVYLERQLWARPDRLSRHKPVKAIAGARRKLGLPVDDGYPRLAMTRRALLAGTAPRFLKSEGDTRHLEACLEWLEVALGELK